MNTTNLIKILLLLVTAGVLSTCKKYKEPVDVGFYMDITKETSLGGSLQFTGGFLVMESFEFDGDREKGDDVFFTKDYPDGLVIPFDETLEIAALDFVIPQGVYKRLDIRFRTTDEIGEVSLALNAIYTYSGGSTIPVKFELEDAQSLEARAEDETDETILLNADVSSPVLIQLDPAWWFDPVPSSLFESADIEEIDGVNTILISKEDNDDIYNLVLDRIDESVAILFNYL